MDLSHKHRGVHVHLRTFFDAKLWDPLLPLAHLFAANLWDLLLQLYTCLIHATLWNLLLNLHTYEILLVHLHTYSMLWDEITQTQFNDGAESIEMLPRDQFGYV